MAPQINEARTPEEWASLGQAIDFEKEISEFPRLSEALEQELSRVDPQNRPAKWANARVAGRIRVEASSDGSGAVSAFVEAFARATLVCQRCLEPMAVDLTIGDKYLLGGQGDASAAGAEVWEYDGERLALIDVVDEGLVMALPFAAKHDDCDASGESGAAVGTEEDSTPATTVKPFAGLRRAMQGASPDAERTDSDD